MKRVLSVLVLATVTLSTVVGCRDAGNESAGRSGEASPSAAADTSGLGTGSGTGTLDTDLDGATPTPDGAGATTAPTGGDAAVEPFPTGVAEVVRTAVPVDRYHALFKQAVAAKYRPVWVDGYDVAGRTYFNVSFRPDPGAAWYEYTEMSASGYQTRFDTLKGQGYRLIFVESYLRGDQVRYAAIWEKSTGPAYYAFSHRSAAELQSIVDSKVKEGYLPAQISGVTVGGKTFFTGLLLKRSLGRSWVVRAELTPASYQTLFNEMTGKGLGLAYVNAYTVNGSVRFVAMFASTASTPFQARHNLTASTLASQQATHTRAGYRTRGIAGYDVGGTANFIAVWAK